MYRNTSPLFDAPNGDVAAYYMGVPESFAAMKELLVFQFNNDHEEIHNYVNNLYALV